MARYSGETVEWLLAEIAQYREAIKKAALGGEIAVVQGEDRRRLEIFPTQVENARMELRELEAELARRPGYEDRGHWAIPVEIG